MGEQPVLEIVPTLRSSTSSPAHFSVACAAPATILPENFHRTAIATLRNDSTLSFKCVLKRTSVRRIRKQFLDGILYRSVTGV